MDMAPREAKWVQVTVPAGHDLYALFVDPDGNRKAFKLVLGATFPRVDKLSADEVARRWPVPPPATPFVPGICFASDPALDPRTEPQKDSAPDTRAKPDPKSQYGWCAGDEDFMRNM